MAHPINFLAAAQALGRKGGLRECQCYEILTSTAHWLADVFRSG